MIGGSVLLLYVMAAVMLWLVPPTKQERECVGKRAAELFQCMYENAGK
jgi:hypothetical protein